MKLEVINVYQSSKGLKHPPHVMLQTKGGMSRSVLTSLLFIDGHEQVQEFT